MQWKVAVVGLSVVCVLGWCDSLPGEVMSKLIIPQHYGVKLCGREFIRAVIFTCGGSRWRRSAEGPVQWSSFSDSQSQDQQPAGQQDPEPIDPISPLLAQSSLSDLIALRSILGRLPQWLADLTLRALQKSSGFKAEVTPEAGERPTNKKRNLSLGLAGICCSHGCTKIDIGRLC
ncbi:prorelaxin H1 [Synchiropus picturatus]